MDAFGNYVANLTDNNYTVPATGGGASGVADDYAGGEPNFTPGAEGVSAIDTSNGRVWWYYNGQWN